MKIYNNFTGGRMDKDVDIRALQKSMYLDAKNVRIVTPDGSNSRAVKFPLGNTQMTALSLGTNAETLGVCIDPFRDKIYWAVVSDSGSYICEYDIATTTENIVLSDTRAGANNLFGFVSGGYVDMKVLNDNDNGFNYLVITDGVNEPKYFEIEAAKALTDSAFNFEDISLIKAPPADAPSLTLGVTASDQENNLKTKFLSFATRYKYQNNEWSALSPFSEFAFLPDGFSYNYKEGTNSAMFNDFSKVDIDFNTGSSNVSKIQLIVKESGSNTAYIVQTYDKTIEAWGDNTTQTITFDNSRIYKALDSNQLSRVYDNVPLAAATVDIIGNRIAFGDYTDGYDLTYSGSDISLSFSLDYVSTAGTSGVVHKQVKTNRDYEIAIAYTDGKGRMTTPLVSDGNTTFVPYSVANQKNQLRVTIANGSRPPDWATGFRFFVKQSKVDYDVLAPVIFYRDGVYAWVKLEGNDIQKVGDGDFIYVKSDTSGLKNTTIRTKVLEISEQVENFLESTTPSPYEVLQEAGVYMRLLVDDFALSEEAVTTYVWSGYSFRSDATANNIDGGVTYVEPIYYDGSDLDDLTQGGALTGNSDIRFEVEITATGTPDTFQWRAWDVTTDDAPGAWTTGVSITGGSQTLSSGITITFGSTTGHTIGDKWFISCKAAGRENDWDKGGSVSAPGRHAIVLLQGKDASAGDEGIKAGANITITYDDSASDSGAAGKAGFLSIPLTSSKDYPNLEEWFYGDNIISSLTGLVWNDDINNVLFRRGTLDKSNGEEMTVTGTHTDEVYMAFLSPVYYTGGARVRIDNGLRITEFDNNIIFETIPQDTNTDIFYELPYTYDITSGNHTPGGTDTNQVFGVTAAVITLPYFNSFGWYNGFESIKIADTFNLNAMVLDTKPLVPVDNYQQIQRIASITYGGVYEATTQFNALVEFNLALANYKDMDTKYGPIRKLHSRDTDLFVFQHDKTHRVLFNKSILYNADGTGNVSQSLNVLGQEVAFTGEYGICNNPESFAFFGNRIYHYDRDRGALMRLSADGYTEISQDGMKDYFRTLASQSRFVGGYDPYNDEYLINVTSDPLTLAYQEGVGFTSFYEYAPERLVGANNRLYSFNAGQIWLHDDNTTRNNFYGVQRDLSITTVFNDVPSDVKHFKSLNLESNVVFDATLNTNRLTGTIADTEFELKEGEYYAYIRQAESTAIDDILYATSLYRGIGTISSISVLTLTMGHTISRGIQIGDTIYRDNGNDTVTSIGTITAVDRDAGTITLDTVTGLSPADFILYGKEARVEGEAMKGYYMQVQLTSSNTTDKELFAVTAQAVRSYD